MAKSVSDYQTAFQNFMEKGARYYACPTGTMLPFAGKTVPAGFLLCNGAEISRTTYARLFSVLGTTWGAGNGSTTFNLPNINDRCLEGTTNTANVGKYLEAGLPDITGTMQHGRRNYTPEITGCLSVGPAKTYWAPSSDHDGFVLKFDARFNNTIFGNSSTNQPNSFYHLMIIKV